jgi:N-acetylglucosaminyldiphosphoundecaprenol N-acetyl-beta-D-mannosaminyltransferase
MTAPLPTVDLLGMQLACVNVQRLLDHVFSELSAGRGGWLITANVDFLRRYSRDTAIRRLYDAADMRVADGMPLVWALALQGKPLPGRIAGASLLAPLARRAAAEGRSLFLLGGTPEANRVAAVRLVERNPGLRIAGLASPRISDPAAPEELDAVVADLRREPPDILLVGLGSPKQERLIEPLRALFPATWMIGVGVSFSFVAGHIRRAPPWLRRSGLEWAHRLAQEPDRLARRYLLENAPFAAELLGSSLAQAVAARLRHKLG